MSNLFFTLDVEEWYHANYDNVEHGGYDPARTNLESNVDRLIDLCGQYNIKSTCFVLGSVAESKPRMVSKLHRAGHEIASHGYGHRLVYNMPPAEFEADLTRANDLLENITGEKVLGFRAPSWSVKEENLSWYYAVLEKLGFTYSSSVYPAQTFLYGIPGFPETAGYPVVEGKAAAIVEIPVPVVNLLGKKIGFSGGFYFRFFPGWFIKRCLRRKTAETDQTFIYLHPREIDTRQPRLSLPLLERFIHYWGIGACQEKLERVIETFAGNFVLMRDGLPSPLGERDQ